MGGGELNMKKSWHPLLIKNRGGGWLEEKDTLAEKKKLDQLRKELEEERQLELQGLQEEQTGRKRQDKPDWMYVTPATGGGPSANDLEDYLLGKKRVDKILIDDEKEKAGIKDKDEKREKKEKHKQKHRHRDDNDDEYGSRRSRDQRQSSSRRSWSRSRSRDRSPQSIHDRRSRSPPSRRNDRYPDPLPRNGYSHGKHRDYFPRRRSRSRTPPRYDDRDYRRRDDYRESSSRSFGSRQSYGRRDAGPPLSRYDRRPSPPSSTGSSTVKSTEEDRAARLATMAENATA